MVNRATSNRGLKTAFLIGHEYVKLKRPGSLGSNEYILITAMKPQMTVSCKALDSGCMRPPRIVAVIVGYAMKQIRGTLIL